MPTDACRFIMEGRRKAGQMSFYFFNNRLEENALNLIAVVTADLPLAAS